ncbi:hypothetical protein CPZ13_06470 [Lacticaseibacillus paracasei]|nr:hypothetical protein B9J76_09105 [Lacticaseibacillus paracasei]PCL23365.1 hypothetical protein CPZ14_07470 [Lacticaseibacillus paracasei]PCL34252.1 hypothetical protein CPZ13_06470 [Lacticaseibacillus paracasei]
MQTTQRPVLALMLLGDFETVGFAGSKRRLRSSYASPAPAGRRSRSLARQEINLRCFNATYNFTLPKLSAQSVLPFSN